MGNFERRLQERIARRGGQLGTVARALSRDRYWREVLDPQNARRAEFRTASSRLFRHLTENEITEGSVVNLENDSFKLGKFDKENLKYSLVGKQARIKPSISVHALYQELLK